MKKINFKKLYKELKKAKRVAIFAHVEPDFDAISSALSFKLALNKIGIQADYIINEKPNEKAILLFGKDFYLTEFIKENYDFFVSMDTPTTSRLIAPEVFGKDTNSLVIDHHKNVDLEGKYNFIDTNYSSCCEAVYDVLKSLKIKIDEEIASILYCGLSTDTGSFVNSNTNENSFKVARNLLKLGANTKLINETLYKSFSEKEIEIKKFIYNNIKIVNQFAYCVVTQETIKELSATKKDFSQISSQLIKLEKINVSFSVVEKELNNFYVSFRAKEGYPVRDIAEKFNGGGHQYACACIIEDRERDIEKIVKIIFNELESKFNK